MKNRAREACDSGNRCRPRRGLELLHGSWGSARKASLHPRLYAIAALRGLRQLLIIELIQTFLKLVGCPNDLKTRFGNSTFARLSFWRFLLLLND